MEVIFGFEEKSGGDTANKAPKKESENQQSPRETDGNVQE